MSETSIVVLMELEPWKCKIFEIHLKYLPLFTMMHLNSVLTENSVSFEQFSTFVHDFYQSLVRLDAFLHMDSHIFTFYHLLVIHCIYRYKGYV